MTSQKLSFALEQLSGENWRAFEKFAAEFLADEFSSLRTTASPSGDRGRDGELFQLGEVPRTGFQYSVAKDWQSKIKNTAARISTTFPGMRRLIYVTSQEIGASADELRRSTWNDFGLQLDIRDRSWFVERTNQSPGRAGASDVLIAAIVEPILQSRSLVKVIATPLDREDSKIALLQLALNSRDDETDRGLTKTCFEALVEAALHGTDAARTMSLQEIQSGVRSLVPAGAVGQVDALVLSAVNRLAKKGGPVKKRPEGYHISFEATEAWKSGTVEYLLDEEAVELDLVAGVWGFSDVLDSDSIALRSEANVLRGALERILMERGEAFAAAIHENGSPQLGRSEISEEIQTFDLKLTLTPDQAAAAIMAVLDGPSDRTRRHLARILDAYTLFAFLQQTPDVRKAFSRIFSEGDIWLDTSAVLPLLGELVIEDDSHRSYSNLLDAAVQSGIQLYVTEGVLEEVERHLNMCLAKAKSSGKWTGRAPFVYLAYMMSGRAESEFAAWVHEIRGDARPVLDVQEFLEHTFAIKRRDLTAEAGRADSQLRGAAQELWMKSHGNRRQYGTNALDQGTISKMIAVDVENAVGIIELRKNVAASPLGYSSWWLTLDSTAYRLRHALRDTMGAAAPDSPVLSPDYLAQILRLGPLRRELGSEKLGSLPLALDANRLENVPKELLDIAKKVRAESSGYSELRIRREVRDALDRARSGQGRAHRTTAHSVETETMQRIGGTLPLESELA